MTDEKPTMPPPSLDEERSKLEAMFRSRRYNSQRARKSADNLLAIAAASPGWGKP